MKEDGKLCGGNILKFHHNSEILHMKFTGKK